MIIERAKPSDYQDLRNLWLVVFNEDETFLEHFFTSRISYQDIFVARVDGKLVSALHALPCRYHKWGKEYPVSYIVGAATYAEFRRQGIMSKLLKTTQDSYDHPITLFPAVRPFYEANGYVTTSSVLSFSLEHSLQKASPTPAPIPPFSTLDTLYRLETREKGALVRDEEAWAFLTEGYQVLSVEGGYAFLSEGKAVEAMAVDLKSAKVLLSALQASNISEVYALPDSPISLLLGKEKGVPIPMGMSTDNELQGVYIAEQY
ncbi:MAG: GNAT family N-acetyltransferase [Sphaerochaetaceae bacterium]